MKIQTMRKEVKFYKFRINFYPYSVGLSKKNTLINII